MTDLVGLHFSQQDRNDLLRSPRVKERSFKETYKIQGVSRQFFKTISNISNQLFTSLPLIALKLKLHHSFQMNRLKFSRMTVFRANYQYSMETMKNK